jgi:hypothetical protein
VTDARLAQSSDLQEFASPLTDSNRRPPPYHEREEGVDSCGSWRRGAGSVSLACRRLLRSVWMWSNVRPISASPARTAAVVRSDNSSVRPSSMCGCWRANARIAGTTSAAPTVENVATRTRPTCSASSACSSDRRHADARPRLRVANQDLARLCQTSAVRRPLEQLSAKLALECCDLPRHRRLAEVTRLPGCGEAPVYGVIATQRQALQIEHYQR